MLHLRISEDLHLDDAVWPITVLAVLYTRGWGERKLKILQIPKNRTNLASLN